MRNMMKEPLVYIHNRWVRPSHKVTITHPDIRVGQYRDVDTIMLYANFQILVDFIEVELAGAHFGPTYFETRGQKVYRVIQELPILGWLLPLPRNARRGLHHLRWSMQLKDSPSQAHYAREKYELYKWWTRTRPNRVDPWSWPDTDVTETRQMIGEDGRLNFSVEYSAKLEQSAKEDDKYTEEDTDMLIRLMRIRGGLWT